MFLQFSLLNGSLHDSYCQGLGAKDDLGLEQLRQCEVLMYTSKVRNTPYTAVNILLSAKEFVPY